MRPPGAGPSAGREGPGPGRAAGPGGAYGAHRPRPTPPPPAAAPAPAGGDEPQPIRGAAARIVSNMEASVGIPTATSFRVVPAKLLEVNRRVINGYLGRTRGGKVSFTHLIGYAVVKGLQALPVMNSSYAPLPDGKPGVVHHSGIGLGLAVDVEKSDGSRTLLVPCIKEAHALDFQQFLAAYEDLIRKVKSNKIAPDDFVGATATLTNPGTIGTVQSVPRLMPGQGVIVGVGTIDYPAEWQAADPATLADLGVSKVVTLTSTYDHRVIQGAESGMFLKYLHECLTGEHDFYEDVFASLGVPYEAVEWRRDNNPVDDVEGQVRKQMQVDTVINMHRVRGHLIADLDPLRWKEPKMHPELDPATYGLTIWDLDREFLTGGLAGHDRLALGEILHILRDAYCRTIGVEYMHIQEPEQKQWIQERVEGVSVVPDNDEQRHILDRLNAAEAFERFLATKYVGAKRFGIEGAESAIPMLDAVLEAAAEDGLDGVVMGMSHRGRLNVLSNIVGKSLNQIFSEFEGVVSEDMVQGSGDVKYHLGAKGTFQSRRGAAIEVELAANPSHLEAVDPVVEGMTPRHAGPHRPAGHVLRAAGAGPRRRRLRRAGRGGGDAQPLRPQGLPGGRHRPPRRQQPARLHHRAGVRPLVPLRHRRGQDGPGADLPRERRRPRGLRPGGPARLRVPGRLRQGRRDRHGLLPAPRAQRGGRPELHAAPHVPAHRPAPIGPQALRRVAGQAGPHHPRRGRGITDRLLQEAADGPRGDPLVDRGEGRPGGAPAPEGQGRAAPGRDRGGP